MIKLQFTIDINATAISVHEMMLGLKDKATYEAWTATFNPTSTFEGTWEQGSKMYFLGFDENGKKGGMISKIVENQKGKFVSILHYGMLDGDIEITTGEQVEKWTGGHENYTFEENNGLTKLTVHIDTLDDYLDYFNGTYPAALQKLKDLIEGNS
jgi:hypothetical protein